MTYLRHAIAPGYGAYLCHLFLSLVHGGKSDPRGARDLDQTVVTDSTITPPLSPGSQLRLIASAGLVVEAADGSIYNANTFFIPRLMLPLDQPVAIEAEVVPASDLDRAIKWLAAKLRQDKTARFADYQAECVWTFKISKLAYKTQVWPAARKMAGLGKAWAGRPPGKKINRLPISKNR
jgi:hypothetical protein